MQASKNSLHAGCQLWPEIKAKLRKQDNDNVMEGLFGLLGFVYFVVLGFFSLQEDQVLKDSLICVCHPTTPTLPDIIMSISF